ncbi:MAG: hypothetical protein ACKV2V_09965 [Blastocatellia bacterium]
MKPLLSFIILAVLCLAQTPAAMAQEKKDEPKVSSGEQDAAKKILEAKDLAAKFKQAQEFLKKYAKSSLRPRVAQYMAEQVSSIPDPDQKASQIDNYLKVFNEQSEKDLVAVPQIDLYIRKSKFDEAFKLADTLFARNPDDVFLLAQLGLNAAEQVQRGNKQFAEKGVSYCTKALEVIDGDKKPAAMKDADWTELKTKYTPQLYRSLGIIAVNTGNMDEGKMRLEQSVSLNAADPYNYIFLAMIADNEYQDMAKLYNVARGKDKEDLLKKVESQIDKTIEYYGKFVALADSNPLLKPHADQVRPNLESYYKFRKGSMDGFQQMLDKYKTIK